MPQKAGPFVCNETVTFLILFDPLLHDLFEGRGDDLHLDTAEDGAAQRAQHSCQGRKLGSVFRGWCLLALLAKWGFQDPETRRYA